MQQYSSKAVDHLGLIAGMVDELGIVELVDSLIPQDLDKRHLSIGQVMKAMCINALGFTGRPLYLTPQFFATKPTELLLGEGISASQINDNTIGRALDKLYLFGVSVLFERISAHAFEVLSLQSAFAHLDSTSFKVYGNGYRPNNKFVTTHDDGQKSRPAFVEITQGFSKDHRPDLSQVMLNMIVENSAGIPMTMEALSGNSSDKRTFAQTVERTAAMIQTHTSDLCVIADSALYSKENLITLARSQLHWIVRVPETITEAQKCITQCYDSSLWEPHTDSRYHSISHKSQYGDIEQTWVIVHSAEAGKRAAKTLGRRYEKQSKKEHHAMVVLGKERYACEADAKKALHKFQHTLRLTQVHARIESIPRFSAKGRPIKGALPEWYDYRIVCTPISSSLASYYQQLHDKSCFIIATNDTTKTASSVIDAYKNQHVVEKGFAFLKKKEFFVDALFLKSPERIEALLMVMTVSLLVYTALEHKIRHALKATNATFKNQKGVPSFKPTARWVFQCFEGIHYLYQYDASPATVINLNDQHRLIISLLGRCYEKIYY